jgi:hypothetical protein
VHCSTKVPYGTVLEYQVKYLGVPGTMHLMATGSLGSTLDLPYIPVDPQYVGYLLTTKTTKLVKYSSYVEDLHYFCGPVHPRGSSSLSWFLYKNLLLYVQNVRSLYVVPAYR